MYNVGVAPAGHQSPSRQKPQRLSSSQGQKWGRDFVEVTSPSSIDPSESISEVDFVDENDEWEEDFDLPIATPSSNSLAFTFAELFERSPATRVRAKKPSGLRSNTILDVFNEFLDGRLENEVNESTEESDEAFQEVESSRSSVRIRALEESQRTFLMPGTIEDFNDLLTTSQRSCLQHTSGNGSLNVSFIDIGLAVGIVLLVKKTLFSLEITLKAPSKWLENLPELLRLSDLSRILFSVSSRSAFAAGKSTIVPRTVTVNNLEQSFTLPGRPAQRSEVFKEIHRKFEPASFPVVIPSSSCPICCDVGDVFRNVCGHGACLSCWKLLIVAKVSEGATQLTCMVPRCGLPVPGSLVGLCAPWHTVEAWQNQQLNVLVTTRQAKFCRNAQCKGIFFPQQVTNWQIQWPIDGRGF